MWSFTSVGGRSEMNLRSRSFLAFAPACAFALAAVSAHAQDEGIQADRPDFTNGPDPVPVHAAQIEMGWAQEHAASDRRDSYGLAVLRWGIAQRMELRGEIPSWLRGEPGPRLDSGFGDAGFGAKFLLSEGRGPAPRLGLIADVDLPSGSKAFKSSGAGYNATLAAEHDFGILDASANVLLGNDDETGEREWTTGASLSLGFAPLRKLDAFAEWYVVASQQSSPQNVLDAGGTVPVGKYFLVDASAGTGVGGGDSPWFVGAGGTWRW